jgi:aminoglycoside phosphotransferase
MVEAGLVDPAALPRPYDRYRPQRLLELLIEGGSVEAGPPVLCHGRPDLDRCLVDRSHFSGFDGLEWAVVADRHLDLAVAHLGVAAILGAEAVPSLYDGYGADPDLILLDHHILAAHLLWAGGVPGALPGAPTPIS